MTFSPEWDQIYRDGRHLAVWPWSDLVSYVCQFAKPAANFRRVLELGCGAGGNIPFFVALGADYCAIEGSAVAVSRLHELHPSLRDRIVCGDFTRAIPFEGPFDLVVDRSAVTHNTTEAIQRTLANAFGALRPGGKFIGIDWFSASHRDAVAGRALDPHTRADVPVGSHLAGTGAVHFSDRDHLLELLAGAGFEIETLEHKSHELVIPEEGCRLAWWHFVAVRP